MDTKPSHNSENLIGAHMGLTPEIINLLNLRSLSISWPKTDGKYRQTQALTDFFSAIKIPQNNTVIHACLRYNFATNSYLVDEFIDECKLNDHYKIPFIVFHPGFSKNIELKHLKKVAKVINLAHKRTTTCSLLIENMTGKTKLCNKLKDLKTIIDHVIDKKRVGICIDTCHAFTAGYDISTPVGYKSFINELETLGLIPYIKTFHFNDSKRRLGTKLDYHQNIGRGYIGVYPFFQILDDDRFKNIPKILETSHNNLKDDLEILRTRKIPSLDPGKNIDNYTQGELKKMASQMKIKGRSKLDKKALFDCCICNKQPITQEILIKFDSSKSLNDYSLSCLRTIASQMKIKGRSKLNKKGLFDACFLVNNSKNNIEKKL